MTAVSWKAIQHGWRVRSSDGEDVGVVFLVVGDENADIFDGLSVSGGFFSDPRYVPSEQVAEITEGRIELRVSRAEIEALPKFQEPKASLEVSGEKASLTDRAAAPFVDERDTPEPTSSWRRLVDRLLGR